MNDREKLWTCAHDIIEGLGPKFGMFKNPALSLAHSNITDPRKLTDSEIRNVLEKLKAVINAP